MEDEANREKIKTLNKERDLRLERRNAAKQSVNNTVDKPSDKTNYGGPDDPPDTTDGPTKAEAAVEEHEIFAFEALVPHGQREVDECELPLALKAVADPDTMCWHQAMREPDSERFREAMVRKITDQRQNGNFTVVKRSNIPAGHKIFPAVWQMRRKRDIKTQEIKKYKARLNLDGSRMRHGVDYEETYAPVTSWRSIRLLLTIVAMHKWHTLQLDYVLAFPQAPVERELFMAIPKGFTMDEGNPSDYALHIHRNIYGQKQAGRVWNRYLVRKLVDEVGFTQSQVDECLFYKGMLCTPSTQTTR